MTNQTTAIRQSYSIICPHRDTGTIRLCVFDVYGEHPSDMGLIFDRVYPTLFEAQSFLRFHFPDARPV